MIGGSHNNSIYYIMRGKSIVYTFLLLCGVKEEDISNIIFTELQDEYLLQFKALVPVVGYYYAKDFLLERKYNINEYPFFLQIASKMNEHNVYTDKYLMFSKTGGCIDRILTLRNKKRKIDE